MKYHVSKKGFPARCTASVKSCPLGEDAPHFGSFQETLEYIEENSKKENETFNSLKRGENHRSEVNDEEAKLLKRIDKFMEEHESKKTLKTPDDEIINGNYTGSRDMVDAIEKQIIEAKA